MKEDVRDCSRSDKKQTKRMKKNKLLKEIRIKNSEKCVIVEKA